MSQGESYEHRSTITASGFYPVFECVLEETADHLAASVHAVMWRFCQYKDGVCKASLETIADALKISRATVQRKQEILVKHNYFKDLTPSLKNKPHVFVDTGRVVIKSQFSAFSRFTEKRHVSESHLSKEEEGLIYRSYEENISPLTPHIAQKLGDLIDEHGKWTLNAIEEAAELGKRNIKYIEAILKRWKVEGYGTPFPKTKNGKQKESNQSKFPIIQAPENKPKVIDAKTLHEAREKAGI